MDSSPPGTARAHGPLAQLGVLLEMIKFQHTIFALPFALIGMLLAARGLPAPWTVFWIVAACVFARTAAMSYNRLVDAEYDARNPRTASRALPAGLLSRRFAMGVTLLCSLAFVASAWMLNSLAFSLSPLAMFVLIGYSYCKRFTSLSHFVLGLALGIAPVGAWVAVRADIGLVPILLSAGVILWTAGFDLAYACQDIEVDRREGLHSIPAKLGVARTLNLSRILHTFCILAFAMAGYAAGLHYWYYTGVTVAALLLVSEHLVISPADMTRINLAFFTINSWVGVAMLLFTSLDIYLVRA